MLPLSIDSFSSLWHFLCFSCRVPAEGGGSQKQGAFPSCQPRSKQLKGEPESPLMSSPTPSPDSPARSSCQPSSPSESNTCNKNLVVSFEKIGKILSQIVIVLQGNLSNEMCFVYFSRVIPKPHQTQRPATGKNTSTLSSTLSVLRPQ